MAGHTARRSLALVALAAVAVAGCNLGAPRQTVAVDAAGLAAGDLNGDGVVDLATAGRGTVAVHLSDGAGGVETTTYVNDDPTGSAYYSGVEVVDGDSDGDLDVVVVQYYERIGGSDIRMWPNDGTGALGAGVPFGGGAFVLDMATGDIDGDGADDLAFVEDFATRITSGNGMAAATTIELPEGGGSGVEMADVDSDGFDDVLVAGWTHSDPGDPASVRLYRATPTGFDPPVDVPVGGLQVVSRAVWGSDLDGDGHIDIVTINGPTNPVPAHQGEVAVVFGDGEGTFSSPVVTPGIPRVDGHLELDTGDIDDDGFADVVLAHPGGVRVMFGDSTGALADPHVLNPSDGGAAGVEVLDVDGDGVDDVVTTGTRLDIFPNRLDGARTHD